MNTLLSTRQTHTGVGAHDHPLPVSLLPPESPHSSTPFSFLLPTTFAVFINYAPLSSSREYHSLSLSLYFFLSIPLPSFRPLPPRCHISYIHPSFFIRLFFSRVRLSRSFSVARAPPRMRASSSHQRSRMMIDANVREASHVRHARRGEAVPSFGRFVHSCLGHTFQQCSLPGSNCPLPRRPTAATDFPSASRCR